jgi:glycosyltransferase involved in cell wall biosynthesis
MRASSVHYDVSSVFDGRNGRLTGIPRTVFEIGRRMVADGAQAIRWDTLRATFVEVDFGDVEHIATHPQRGPMEHWRWFWGELRCRPAAFSDGDTMVSLGIWWAPNPLEALMRLRKRAGIGLVGWVHDLIPIRRPEFFDGGPHCTAFNAHIRGLLQHADAICIGSAHVAADVEALAAERGWRLPPVRRVPLCSDLPLRVSADLTPSLASHALEPGRFALMVSSINPRKNHAWAYRLWCEAFETLGPDLPTLVFAGEPGWGGEDLLRTLSADTRIWGRHVKFVPSPSDAELAWLYASCAYTLYPSQMEGWGLPISESLSFGKHCLAADNSSLPEAGAGLAFHAGLDDTPAWLAEIARLARQPGYLAACERRIATRYRARSWDEVTAGVMEAVDAACVPSPGGGR